jgi:pimeloyl-ACP methyl ester carboxylesterase
VSQTLWRGLVGSGHFCQLEVPEQVNAMIDRFLAITFPA